MELCSSQQTERTNIVLVMTLQYNIDPITSLIATKKKQIELQYYRHFHDEHSNLYQVRQRIENIRFLTNSF